MRTLLMLSIAKSSIFCLENRSGCEGESLHCPRRKCFARSHNPQAALCLLSTTHVWERTEEAARRPMGTNALLVACTLCLCPTPA